MDKRKADEEMVPLKKIVYTEAVADTAAAVDLDESVLREIEMHRKMSLYLRMEDYKRRYESLAKEYDGLCRTKVLEIVDGLVSAAPNISRPLGEAEAGGPSEEAFKNSVVESIGREIVRRKEMEETVYDLRSRVERLKLKSLQGRERSSDGPCKANNENSSENIFKEEIKHSIYIDKENALFAKLKKDLADKDAEVEELRHSVEKARPADTTAFKQAISRLEEDNREMVELALGHRREVEREKERVQELRDQVRAAEEAGQERERDAQHLRDRLEGKEAELKNAMDKIEELAKMLSICTVKEMLPVPVEGCPSCSAYRERARELEETETERMEEVSYLASKYGEVTRRNTELERAVKERAEPVQSQSQSAPQLSLLGAQQQDVQRLRAENKRLEVEVERVKAEFIERKSAAMYHKRQSLQMEGEVTSLAKTIREMDTQNNELFAKNRELKREKCLLEIENKKIEYNNRRLEGMVDPSRYDVEDKEITLYRKMVKCGVCDVNYKEVVLSKCMHMFCKECVQRQYNSRQRTCPLCAVAFSMGEVKGVFL